MKKHLLFLSLFAAANAFGQAVPNGTFESWSITPYSEPAGTWYTSNPQSLSAVDSDNVTKVIGYSGQAVHMRTIIKGTDTDFAYITNTPGDPSKAQGGVPYNQMSTGITGYYRCNLPVGDTGLLLILFKKSGSVIGQYGGKFYGTMTSFSLFNFPFVPALSMAPDTMIIASASSNAITKKGIHNGSWLELDQLAFTGPSIAISGGTFDSWTSQNYDVPIGWANAFTAVSTSGVTQTTAKYAGSYAVSLQSQVGYGGVGVAPGVITTGQIPPKGNIRGGRPYTLTKDTLTGYYFYNTPGNDSGMVNVTLTKNGSMVGGGGIKLKAVGVYTYFKIPIAGSTPDTMRVDIISSVFSPNANSSSALVIDNLSLKSQPLGLFDIGGGNTNIKTFPNPAKDQLNIELSNQMTGTAAHVYVYDITGRTVLENDMNIDRNLVQLNVEGLKPGIYLYKINTENGSFVNRFVKE